MTLRVALKRAPQIIAVVASLCITSVARAQVTPATTPASTPATTSASAIPQTPKDTTIKRDAAFIRDSLLRVDSIRQKLHDDSLPQQFPALNTSPSPASYAFGVWEWDQAALMREGNITLGDLLRRVPAMTALRAGGYLQPENVVAFGQTRGRNEIEIDGYVLDPLTTSSYDLASIEVANLVDVRVERRLDVTRIKLTTAAPISTRPYTRLDVATGQPDIDLFRSVFLVPKVIVGPLGLGIEHVGTNGLRRSENASNLSGWAKWSWSTKTRGVQFEYRRAILKRQGLTPWPTDEARQDLTFRARAQLATGFTAELFGGRGTVRQVTDTARVPTSTNDSLPVLKRAEWQGGARAAFVLNGAYANATLRLRDAGAALPKQELDLGAGYDMKLLHIGGDFMQQGYDANTVVGATAAKTASTYDVRAAVGPMQGFGAFAEYASGDRGAAIWDPSFTTDSGSVSLDRHDITSRDSYRVGATINRWGINGGGAIVSIKPTSTTAPLGAAFDTAFAVSLVTEATGFETWGRIALLKNRAFLDASYMYWTKSPGWTYMPTRSWRIAGEVHLSPLPSGNLEILGRVESIFRGAMLAYGTSQADPDSVTNQFEPLQQNGIINAYLQIRIIDVRIFIQSEDMLGNGRLDIPGRLIGGPRLYYGVKWDLFN